GWDKIGTRGGLVMGAVLLLAYLLAGYMAGRMAWRRGIVHGVGVFVGSLVVVGAVALIVRSLAKDKDIKAITDALRSFGVPTTRDEWRHVDSFVGIASLVGMLAGSVIGGLAGERWYSRVSRRAMLAEADGIDVREPHTHAAGATRNGNGNGTRNGNGNGNGNGRSRQADLDELTKEELYEMAQEKDIAGRSQMSKDELKKALQKQH
ncbi:MAG TPA: Rho termination factor N-terminal domain-containing protein, partial [Acidimicrobiia bacterium]|nr:Rho termination factor N-terminal domain-containing protein [Acidimicrobiia bacterium]